MGHVAIQTLQPSPHSIRRLVLISGFITIGFIGIALYAIGMYQLNNGWKIIQNNKYKIQANTTNCSIIIPFRNEEKNLQKTLQSLEKQIYATNLFEVVLIDDFSSDNSVTIVNQFIQQTSLKIKLIHLKDSIDPSKQYTNNKKTALTLGVESCIHNHILSIDADVWMGNRWLESMLNYFESSNAVFFSAPVLYPPQNGISSIFLETDQINNIAIAASSMGIGDPSLCNGANMAFTKTAWNEVGGFKGIEHIPSGDDMLLMHRMKEKFPDKVGYCIETTTIVYTEPVNDFSSFVHQRTRWFSKTFQYEHKSTTWQLIFGFAINLMVVLALIFYFTSPVYFALILILKISVDMLFLKSPLRFFNRAQLWWYIPITSILFSFYVVFIGLIALIFPYKWKK